MNFAFTTLMEEPQSTENNHRESASGNRDLCISSEWLLQVQYIEVCSKIERQFLHSGWNAQTVPEEGGGLICGTVATGTAPRDGEGHHPSEISSSRKCVLALVPSHPRNQRCWWGEEKLLENSSHAFFTASKVSSAIPVPDSPLISSPKNK